MSGSPKVISYINDPVTPVGWTSRYQTTFKWAAPLFGEQSVWNRYELYPGVGGDLQARTEIIADVIDTPDLQTFAAFGVEQCYQFHGYSLANVSQMSLAGGITGQSLAYTSQQFGSWTIVYWILPVKRGAPAPRLRAGRALRPESTWAHRPGHTADTGGDPEPGRRLGIPTAPSRPSFCQNQVSWWPTPER